MSAIKPIRELLHHTQQKCTKKERKKITHKGDGEQKENKEGRRVDEWTTAQTPGWKMKRRKSDERIMGRGERMRDYVVTDGIFYSSSDGAHTCSVQRPFLTRHPPSDLRFPRWWRRIDDSGQQCIHILLLYSIVFKCISIIAADWS